MDREYLRKSISQSVNISGSTKYEGNFLWFRITKPYLFDSIWPSLDKGTKEGFFIETGGSTSAIEPVYWLRSRQSYPVSDMIEQHFARLLVHITYTYLTILKSS